MFIVLGEDRFQILLHFFLLLIKKDSPERSCPFFNYLMFFQLIYLKRRLSSEVTFQSLPDRCPYPRFSLDMLLSLLL